jgi:hypothetical protein
MAGLLGVIGGLAAVKFIFPSVRRRTVAWYLGLLLVPYWGYRLLQLFTDLIWRPDAFPQNWAALSLPYLIQALVAVGLAWKMTATSDKPEKDTQLPIMDDKTG